MWSYDLGIFVTCSICSYLSRTKHDLTMRGSKTKVSTQQSQTRSYHGWLISIRMLALDPPAVLGWSYNIYSAWALTSDDVWQLDLTLSGWPTQDSTMYRR